MNTDIRKLLNLKPKPDAVLRRRGMDAMNLLQRLLREELCLGEAQEEQTLAETKFFFDKYMYGEKELRHIVRINFFTKADFQRAAERGLSRPPDEEGKYFLIYFMDPGTKLAYEVELELWDNNNVGIPYWQGHLDVKEDEFSRHVGMYMRD